MYFIPVANGVDGRGLILLSARVLHEQTLKRCCDCAQRYIQTGNIYGALPLVRRV